MSETKTTEEKPAGTTPEKGASAKAILQNAAEGLLLMSESDRPLSAFTWNAKKTGEVATAQDALIAAIKPDAEQVRSLTIEALFAPMMQPKDWWGDDEKALCAKFQTLTDAIKQNLTDPQAFRVEGDSEIPVYIIGKDAAGTWSGVRSTLVET